ncbi:hypothetical protein [Vallitalea okinawensis]|uniref:hypothetical protein n=1 Tax=Vallitalea okinawensis TaxID=2078660 RepID=UPI000CFC73BF|nr:hypothetical protein [Vallitalea okinawensis]
MKYKFINTYLILLVLIVSFFIFWVVNEPDIYAGHFYLNAASYYVDNYDVDNALTKLENVKESNVIEQNKSFEQFYNYLTNRIEGINSDIILKGQHPDGWISEKVDIKIINETILDDIDIPSIGVKGSIHNVEGLLPLELKLLVNGEVYNSAVIDKAGEFSQNIIIEKEYLLDKSNQLELKVNKTFNPKKMGINNDSRDLSIIIEQLDFHDYLDIVTEEEMITVDGLYSDNWMGVSTRINLVNQNNNIEGLKISGKHLFENPMKVIIESQDDVLDVIELNTPEDFEKIIYLSDELKEKKFISLEMVADNTFVPQELQINEDSRSLSILVDNIEILY